MYTKTKKFIDCLQHEGIFPGASFAFIQNKQIEQHTQGYAQIMPQKVPLEKEMLFDVASLTKVICTTTMILKLVELGKINIENPLHQYLPEFKDTTITIRQLLTHTSDIQSYIPNRDALSAHELKKAMLALPAGKKMDKQVVYTDTGMILLGFLLEKIYQKPLQTIFKEEVLDGIGMNQSGFGPINAKKCVATENHPLRGVIRGEVHDPKAYTLGVHCGSAGLFTTLKDMISFVNVYLDEGKTKTGKEFLKSSTIKSLATDWTTSGNLGRSLGWSLLDNPVGKRPLLYHSGYTGTFVIIDCLQKSAFIFLSNRVHPVDQRAKYLKKRNQLIEVYLSEKMFYSQS